MSNTELTTIENKNDLLLRLSEPSLEGREVLSLVLAYVGDLEIERAALEAFDAATMPRDDLGDILGSLENIDYEISSIQSQVRDLERAAKKGG